MFGAHNGVLVRDALEDQRTGSIPEAFWKHFWGKHRKHFGSIFGPRKHPGSIPEASRKHFGSILGPRKHPGSILEAFLGPGGIPEAFWKHPLVVLANIRR